MSHLNACIISVLFLVLIGPSPCESTRCSYTAIDECWKQEFTGHCPFYKKIADCLETIEKTCSDDTLQAKLNDELEANHARHEQCPGLNGQCFSDVLVHCQDDIPWTVKIQVNLSDEARKKRCNTFEGKKEGAKNCMKSLKDGCTADHNKKTVDSFLEEIDELEDICDKLTADKE